MTKIIENRSKASSGILIGLAKQLYVRPFFGIFSAKVSIYNSNLEYQSEFRGGYRWFQYFIRYYKLGPFDELSLGVGAQFSYYKRKRNG